MPTARQRCPPDKYKVSLCFRLLLGARTLVSLSSIAVALHREHSGVPPCIHISTIIKHDHNRLQCTHMSGNILEYMLVMT